MTMNLREHHHEPSSQLPAVPVAQTDYRMPAERLLAAAGPTIEQALSLDARKFLEANRQQSAQ